MPPSSAALWKAWRDRREEGAFEQLVLPCLPLLHDTARRAGLDAAASDDAVQDALVALAADGSSRPAEVGVVAWLVRAVRLRALTLGRGARRRRTHERLVPMRVAESPTSPFDARERAEFVLSGLAEDERELLRLRFVYDLEYRDIAYILGVAESTCRVRVHRASERLRARFGDSVVALLPGLRPTPRAEDLSLASRAVAAGATSSAIPGGLLMALGTKVGVGIATVAILGGTWALTRNPSRSADPAPLAAPRSASVEPTSAPVLAGRGFGEQTATPGSETPPSASEPASRPGSIDALVAEIKRRVRPEAWTERQGGSLDARGAVVIARAPDDVLDEVAQFLEQQRERGAIAAAGGGPVLLPIEPEGEGTPEERNRAGEAIQRLLRQAGTNEDSLRRFLSELDGARPESASAWLDAVRRGEPDLELLGMAESALNGGDAASASKARADLSSRLEALERAPTLKEWALRWPSATTWKALSSAAGRAGDSMFVLRGTERDAVLDSSRIEVEFRDEPLVRVVHRLSVEVRCDLVVDLRPQANLANARVERLDGDGRSLRQVLDDLVTRLPEGTRLDVRPAQIRLTRSGLPPETKLRYFDVHDLVADSTAPAETPAGAPVLEAPPAAPANTPAPPVYVAPPGR